MKNSSNPAKSSGKLIECQIEQAKSAQLITETQLAAHWNISIKTLQAKRWKGSGIPFIKIGRSVGYRMTDVIAYEALNTKTWGAL